MDETAISPAMAGASETPTAPSESVSPPAAETQTGEAPTVETPESTVEDFASRYKNDPAFKAWADEHAGRKTQQTLDRKARAEARRIAREAAKAHDEGREDDAYSNALQVARQLAEETDPEEAEVITFRQKADSVRGDLERLAKRPEYKALYEREGRDKMAERYRKDPVAFAEWVDDQIVELRADARARKQIPVVADAVAESKVNQTLAGVPVPVTGSAGGGGAQWTRERIERGLDPDDYRKNRDAILKAVYG